MNEILEIDLEIAKVKALYAAKSLDRANQSASDASNSVSPEELDSLTMAVELANLDVKKAEVLLEKGNTLGIQMSILIDFYNGTGTDSKDRKLQDILNQDDEFFEWNHTYIQWLFPLKEPSNFNPDAPLLTEEDIQAFNTNSILREKLFMSFLRFLEFLGMGTNGSYDRLVFSFPSHNWLRITRVLKSLRILGLREEAIAFYKVLEKIHKTDGVVSENAFSYWKEAVHGLVAL